MTGRINDFVPESIHCPLEVGLISFNLLGGLLLIKFLEIRGASWKAHFLSSAIFTVWDSGERSNDVMKMQLKKERPGEKQ